MPGPPRKQTTFADIPAELRQLILQGGSIEPDLDFLVCTSMRRSDDSAMPLTGMGTEADLVVRGMVCGGTLYIKHIYSLKEDERVPQFDPNKPHPEVRTGGPKSALIDAEWCDTVHRSQDGSVRWARYGDRNSVGTKPLSDRLLRRAALHRGDRAIVNEAPIGHVFYADETTRRLYLSLSYDEAKLLYDRHRLAPLRDEREAPWVETEAKMMGRLQTQLDWRYEDIVDSDEFMLRPIKNGRAKAGSNGTDLLLALSKDIKIYTDGNIIASLPIVSKVTPEQPNDEFMSNPICEAQLKSTNGKWLLCVPMDWIYHFQKEVTDHNATMNKWLRTKKLDYGDTPFPPIDSTASRIDHLIATGFFDYRDNEWPVPNAHFSPKLRLTKRGTPQQRATSHPRREARNSATIPGTSFDRVAPLLVACFLAQSSPAYDVKDPATHEKLMHLSLDEAFQDTYGLNGPHVEETSDVLRGRPAKELEALASGCTGFPELDIFGGAALLR